MYAELVFDQRAPTWIACHRHAFEFWGGVPKRVVPDNLRAAVRRVAIDEPVLAEAYRQMALHYGFLISPTRPHTPRHKGKVESVVHYVKRNFLAGRKFTDAQMANRELLVWVIDTAGQRTHGTTKQPPLRLFNDLERAVLLPLPDRPFSLMETKLAKVHPDGHVTLAGSYYSVPYHYVGKLVELHVYQETVQIYSDFELVCTHPRATGQGKWMTRLDHLPTNSAAYLGKTPSLCRSQASKIGPATREMVDRLFGDAHPLDQLRSVQGLLRLADAHGQKRLEAACARALRFGKVTRRGVKEILNAGLDMEPLPEAQAVATAEDFEFSRTPDELFSLPQEMER
jgi:hypothetical protein